MSTSKVVYSASTQNNPLLNNGTIIKYFAYLELNILSLHPHVCV